MYTSPTPWFVKGLTICDRYGNSIVLVKDHRDADTIVENVNGGNFDGRQRLEDKVAELEDDIKGFKEEVQNYEDFLNNHNLLNLFNKEKP